MIVQNIWLRLSLAATVLMAAVSAAGFFSDVPYAKETVSWGAQATGQDIVNIVVVLPLFLVSLYFLRKQSVPAFLVWLGVLIYLIYCYILYAFFIHFGPLFLAYTAIFGLSTFAFLGGLIQCNYQAIHDRFARVNAKPARVFLLVISVMFIILWMGDILRALITGGLPQGLADIGLPVNPIQVLDLALLLPSAAIVASLLNKKETLGYVLAVPLLVFFAVMGIAIIVMMILLSKYGFAVPIPQMVMMGIIAIVDTAIITNYLKGITR